MTFLRLCAVSLILLSVLSLAACSGMGCKSDNLPVYPDLGKPAGEPHKSAQE